MSPLMGRDYQRTSDSESPLYKIQVDQISLLATREQCLFICDIFFRMLYMEICYVHFSQLCITIQVLEIIKKTEFVTCASVCTEGRGAVIRWFSGFTIQVKEVTFEFASMHYLIHREMLDGQKHYLNLTMF